MNNIRSISNFNKFINLSNDDIDRLTRDFYLITSSTFNEEINEETINELSRSLTKLLNKYDIKVYYNKIDSMYVNNMKSIYNAIMSVIGLDNIGSEKSEVKSLIFNLVSHTKLDKFHKNLGFYTILADIKILQYAVDSKSNFNNFLINMQNMEKNDISFKHNILLLTYALIKIKNKIISEYKSYEEIKTLLNTLIVNNIIIISN